MNKTVRYCLEYNAPIAMLLDESQEKITVFPDKDNPIFVDLLEKCEEGLCKQVRIKAYFPNGDIIIGSVVGFVIGLHNKDALYDGRFNA